MAQFSINSKIFN